MDNSSDYRAAYERAKLDLAEALSQQERLGKMIVTLRQTIQSLAVLCEEEQIEIDPSDEADYLLQNSSLADEIRAVLCGNYEKGFRPSEIKDELKHLGRDLGRYRNPQATIHMVLKRMAESKEIVEKNDPDGKKRYLMEHPLKGITRRPRGLGGRLGASLASAWQRKK